MGRIGKKITLTIAALLTVFAIGYKTLPSILPLPKADIEIHRSQNVDREYYNRELEKSQQRQDRMCDLNDFKRFDMSDNEKNDKFIESLNNKHNVELEDSSKYDKIIQRLGKKIHNSTSNKEQLPESIYLTIFQMFHPKFTKKEKTSIELGREYERSSFWPSKKEFKGDCTESSRFIVSLVESMKQKGIEAYVTRVIEDEESHSYEIYFFNIVGELFTEPGRGGHVCAMLKFNNKPILLDFLKKEKGFDVAHKKIQVLNKLEATLLYHKQLSAYGDDEEALDNLQIILKIDPEDVGTRNDLGQIYLKQGEYKQAIIEFEKILEINPKYQPAYNNLGVIYCNLNELDKAIKYFELALANPMGNQHIKWPCIHWNIGAVLLKQEKNKEAVKKFAQVLEICYENRIYMPFPELSAGLLEKMPKEDYLELTSIIETLKTKDYEKEYD